MPAPFGPTIPRASPGSTSSERSSATTTRPNRFEMPCELQERGGQDQAFVGWRSPPTGTSGLRLLSTTTISHGYVVPLRHWTPTGRIIPMPGKGPFVKSSGPQMPV